MTWTPKNQVDDIKWNERHSTLATLITPNVSEVYDFGCGKQNLKKFLCPSVSYKGFDKHLHSPENILLDFNSSYIDNITLEHPEQSAVVFEGILEYLNDPIACVSSTAMKLKPFQIIITIHPQDNLRLRDKLVKHVRQYLHPESTYIKKNIPIVGLMLSLYGHSYRLLNILYSSQTFFFSFQRL
jgi:hypothetical protein